ILTAEAAAPTRFRYEQNSGRINEARARLGPNRCTWCNLAAHVHAVVGGVWDGDEAAGGRRRRCMRVWWGRADHVAEGWGRNCCVWCNLTAQPCCPTWAQAMLPAALGAPGRRQAARANMPEPARDVAVRRRAARSR